MNKLNFFIREILVIAALAAFLAACAAGDEALQFSGVPAKPAEIAGQLPLPDTGASAPEPAASRPQARPAALVQLHAAPGSDIIVGVLTPSLKPLAVVGRDASGAWLAVASSEGGHPLGWIQAGELAVAGDLGSLPVMAGPSGPRAAVTAILAKVYARPEAGSPVVGVLMAGETLTVVERSADGAWAAVARPDGTAQGWVLAGDLKQP